MTFAFQGGEPTLSGLPFFRRFVELVRAHNTRNLTVHSAIQTNGILLDGEWAAFLAENRFLVGLSLDGTAAVHDLHRVDARGEGTHKRLMAAVRTLQAHKVEFNVLTVVTARPPGRSGPSTPSFAETSCSTSSTSPAWTRWARRAAAIPTP